MKKLINAPERVIEDYIDALVTTEPRLARLDGHPVVVRAVPKTAGRVALVSGGGSGHEPAHAGYVGLGMLDGAVLGPVFTSPSVDDVYAAIRAVATDAGVLLVVKNYTGDRLNFGLAAEMARADGVAVETVVVADDVSLGDEAGAGRRGLAGTVLVHKVAGAAAERGLPLAEVKAVAERFLGGLGTMGVALGACTIPGATEAGFRLGADEVEWGLGIHGEPGHHRDVLRSARETADMLVSRIWADLDGPGDVAVLVNSLGGTPELETRIVLGEVVAAVAARGGNVRATWAGAFLTALEMPGVSVSIAKVDAESLPLLLEESDVAAFPRATAAHVGRQTRSHDLPPAPAPSAATARGAGLFAIASALAHEVIAAEPHLSDLDRRVGDGDMGINLARGARAVLDAQPQLAGAADGPAFLRATAAIARRVIGGTSGPLYGVFLLGMAEELAASEDWNRAFARGLERVQHIGGARPGDRTMVDALVPAADALSDGAGVRRAAEAARDGAESTAASAARRGRSSYLGERAIGAPDPGAVAVALLLERLAAELATAEEGS